MPNQSTRRAFMAAPALAGIAARGQSRNPVTGEGGHRFEVIHDWGELPRSISYGNTHGVCVDGQGHVYVHHTVHATSVSEDTMVVFDEKGRFVRSWGKEFKGGAHGLHIRKEGSEEFLYLCDTKRAVVVKTTLKGEEVFSLGYPKESPNYPLDGEGKPAARYSPTNLAIGPNGDIYVADGYGSNYINQYDAKGKFIRTFGGKGAGEGQLNQPHGIALDVRGAEPALLVADRGNRRFQYFSLDGRHLRFSAIGDVKLPCHFDQRRGLLLTPDLEARVTLMDERDKVLAQLGDDPSNTWGQLRKQERAQFVPGKFICPHSACFDGEGNIFVVEWVEVGRVTKLRRLA